jgi:endonuclease-8
MNGAWHLYRPGERWYKPPSQARAVLETADFVAVCFNAPVVELLAAGGVERHEGLRRLGPDLLKEDFDPIEARRRLRERGDLAVGDALMAQSALAGIGNVYKSETLFLCRMNPFTRVDELDDETLDRLVAKARELMKRNLEGFPRRTRSALAGPRLWVYDRSGKPCLECGTLIEVRRQGLAGRTTYYCPTCQR